MALQRMTTSSTKLEPIDFCFYRDLQKLSLFLRPIVLLFIVQTGDKTEARATNQNELVERIRDRIILEHMDLIILVINLENPQGWKECA